MTVSLQLIEETWNALQPFVREQKCASCECLQGALVELRLALEDLPESPDQGRLLSTLGQAMNVQSPHGCLGCEPCNPGDILAGFYRNRQTPDAAACACEDG